jgi:hypothetical protein
VLTDLQRFEVVVRAQLAQVGLSSEQRIGQMIEPFPTWAGSG